MQPRSGPEEVFIGEHDLRAEEPLCLRSTGDKAILKQKGGERE